MKRAPALPAADQGESRPRARKVKLAEQVAGQIMADIRRRGWPMGELLGTEADLIARYHVSRATLGEAVRLVEANGAARMMRGPRGGLIVSAPALDTVLRTIGNYLEYADTSLEELFEAFLVIETLSVRMAAEAIDGEGIETLRNMVAEIPAIASPGAYRRHLMAIRLRIADASGNGALVLLMRVLVRVLTHIVWRHAPETAAITPDLAKISIRVAALVEAVVAGDVSLAEELVRADLGDRTRSLGRMVKSGKSAHVVRKLPPAENLQDDKAADRIARMIVNDIRSSGLECGQRLGQEVELMERYGTSRWVIRQAIRALEVHAIVHSKRGQGGGLTISRPDPAHTVETAQTYLHATGIPPQAFAELWHELLGAVARLAAQRATPDNTSELVKAAAAVNEMPFETVRDRQNDVYLALAKTGGNRVFVLFVMIISRYLTNFKVKVSQPTVPAQIVRSIDDMTRAVMANDEGLARRMARIYSDIIRGYVTFIDKFTPEAEKMLE